MMINDFGAVLHHFRLRAGLSQNALAGIVGVNASYINRVERRQRGAPSRRVVLALARGLALSRRETDCCCVVAGLAPPSLQRLGPADSTVAAVLDVLTDDRLSPAALADFRAVVETLAYRWQRQRCQTDDRPSGAVNDSAWRAPQAAHPMGVATRRQHRRYGAGVAARLAYAPNREAASVVGSRRSTPPLAPGTSTDAARTGHCSQPAALETATAAPSSERAVASAASRPGT